jgi:hypothetical protein
MSLKADNRWQAFGIHIVISGFLFVALSAVIYFCWYPGFLFYSDGGLEGMKLIAGVDFFIGPLLTLIVYKVGKKSLPFDLTCIGFLQVLCLAGGMWTVWQTRPVAVVFAGGEYVVTHQNGYKEAKIGIKNVPLLQSAWPVWLATDVPDDQQKQISMAWAVSGGLQYGIELYIPYADYVPRLVKSGVDFEDVKKIYQNRVSAFEGQNNIHFYPLTTSMYTGHVAVDTSNGQIIEFFH